MMKKRFFTVVVGSIVAVVIGWGMFTAFSSVAQSNATLLVSAAASLQNALEEIDPLFEQANRGAIVNYNFGSSGALQQQIEQGAPADVFFSAAQQQMDALQQRNLLLPGTRRNLLTNRLVLIVPSNSQLGLTSFRQLTESRVRRIAVGEARSVPVGQYTEQLLTNLGILAQLRSKFVYGNNVRNVLAAVESGNVDAGIVYTTDARISNRVRQVATAPSNLHAPIVYPIAVLQRTRNADAARRYVNYLSSSRAIAIFRRYGFGVAQ